MKHYIATTLSEFWKGSEQHFSQVIAGKRQEYKDFMVKLKLELENTKEAKEILIKYTKGGKISPEEQLFFKKQVLEVSKSIGLGIPILLIPGGMILLSFIIWLSKKYNIDILPSYLK